MPGIASSAPRPANSNSTYRSSSSKHSSQPISGPAGPSSRRTSSSRGLVSSVIYFLQLELLPKLSSRVVERLVEGAARGAEPLGENVDRDPVHGQGNEHLTLVRRELCLDHPGDLPKELAALRLRVRRGGGIGKARPFRRLERDLAALPCQPPDLHGRLEQREL